MTQGRTGGRQCAGRAPVRQAVQFPLWCKGSKDVRWFPKHPQRFPFWCNKTMTTSPQDGCHRRAHLCIIDSYFAGEDRLRTGRDVLLSPFKFGHCGIPSRHCDKGRGPGPLLYIEARLHHRRGDGDSTIELAESQEHHSSALARLEITVLVHPPHLPERQSTKVGVGYYAS